MILSAHQPSFLPWLGFINKIARSDFFVIFDDVPFERHGFGNRNKIKTHEGAQWLTVPVKMDGHMLKPIRQIENAEGNWKRKHLKTIELAYQKAPYFDKYYPRLCEIYNGNWRYLSGFSNALLHWILDELKIDTPLIMASEQGFVGSKSDLVLNMCVNLGATKYIFGKKGKDYADIDSFEEAGIEIEFQNYQHPVYPQINGEFIRDMSVIDLMFNCGDDSLSILMGE